MTFRRQTSNLRMVNQTPVPSDETQPSAARAGLSACIIAFNEADRIADSVRSVAFCDEVLVIDSGSTDATVEIARRCGAKVLHNPWPGYRTQKQFAVNQAAHDFVLSIDADERVTNELRNEIESLRDRGLPGCSGWTIPRLTDYCGAFLRHGNSYPDRAVRLFDRRHSHWGGYEVHESLKTEGPIGQLSGHIEHFSYRDLDDHLARMHRYAALMADELVRAGKRKGLAAVILNPAWRFFRGMVIKGGWLDGWRGLAFHLVEARYVREKYLRVWLASRAEGQAFVLGRKAPRPKVSDEQPSTPPVLPRPARWR
jgi:glycosyltransferase involved in cell wall biosynthesis